MSETNNTAVAEKPKRKRPDAAAYLPIRQQPKTPEEKAVSSRVLRNVLNNYRQPRVKNDEELVEAIERYFERCEENESIPTMEGLYISTGYGIEYMGDIAAGRRKGFTPSTAIILKKAKDILRDYDAQMALSNKINFLAYCFRAKNYYGMVDKQEHVITPNTRDSADYNEEEIAKKYLVDGGENYVDTTLSDS